MLEAGVLITQFCEGTEGALLIPVKRCAWVYWGPAIAPVSGSYRPPRAARNGLAQFVVFRPVLSSLG